MVTSVGSSPKAVYGLLAVSALAITTVLFLRSRSNAAAQPAASSLDKGRFSFVADLPIVGCIYNYFNPTKTIRAPEETSNQLPNVTLGSAAMRIDSIEKLKEELEGVKNKHPSIGALIIYSAHFGIYEDPGILALNPERLILVGPRIVSGVVGDDVTLRTQMISLGWHADVDFSASTLEEALGAKLETNPDSSKPTPKVFSVHVSLN